MSMHNTKFLTLNMSTKTFKESLKTQRDGLDYDAFVKKFCPWKIQATSLETMTTNELYDFKFQNIKSKDSGKVKYKDVCPTQPPIVPGLIIGLMNEIEKRIPPIHNIVHGYTESSSSRSEAILDSIMPRCKCLEDIPFTLYEEPTWCLFQILQLFLDRLESPVFCVDINLASNEKFYSFPLRYNHGASVNKVSKCIDRCLAKMRREQVATTAFIIQKIQLWTLLNVRYQLQKHPTLSTDSAYIESIDFFRSRLGKYVVGLPIAHLRCIEMRKFQKGDDNSCATDNIFALITSDVSCDYWHDKTVEVFNSVEDNDVFKRDNTIHGERSSLLLKKHGFHWIDGVE